MKDILLEAAKRCRVLYDKEIIVKYKAPNNPVSNIDVEMNDLIKQGIRKYFPDDNWCSEEDPFQKNNSKFTWIVDPIDGTRSLIKKIPEFTVSMALMYESEIVAGGVINPITKESWFVGEESNVTDLMDQSIIRRKSQKDILVSYSQEKSDLDQLKGMGSIALRMCKIVSGEGLAAISLRYIHSWDIAAAYIIAKKANLVITNCKGEAIMFEDLYKKINGVVVSLRDEHREILDAIGQRRI
tara:strand:- start:246 stop:968 length:723 start_codon:yes stop_codon:yes gene_type:complete